MKKLHRSHIVTAKAGPGFDYLLNEALGRSTRHQDFTTDTDAALGIIEALAAADATLNFTLDVGMMKSAWRRADGVSSCVSETQTIAPLMRSYCGGEMSHKASAL